MTKIFSATMRKATALTRDGNLAAATRAIQEALGATPVGPEKAAAKPRARRAGAPLGDVVNRLAGRSRVPSPPLAEGARFEARRHDGPSGGRDYRLYVPAVARPSGVLVLLHGCTQTPEVFAVGTRMNREADRAGLVVVYPEQPRAANASRCWNWFQPGDQARGAGEPAILAGIVATVQAEFGLDRDATFVAGLSAGGAMAVVLGATYPDLVSAVGAHSGLAHGAARDVPGAFAAMKGQPGVGQVAASGQRVRTILFHGTEDGTVHPVNADAIRAAASPDRCTFAPPVAGRINGRRTLCTDVLAEDGALIVQDWRIEGAGHAWSGGDPAGSHTDPSGPDASRLMVEFFLGGAPKRG